MNTERFAQPGKTLIGSDSHTPTAGAVGCLAIGAGGIDAAIVLAGHPFEIETQRIENHNSGFKFIISRLNIRISFNEMGSR